MGSRGGRAQATRYRHRAVFLKRTRRCGPEAPTMADDSADSADSADNADNADSADSADSADEEVVSRPDPSETDFVYRPSTHYYAPIMIRDYFTQPPRVRDALVTETSEQQDATVAACLPFLHDAGFTQRSADAYNEFGVPRLLRARHVEFLTRSLGALPGVFVGYDASRPWLLYWNLHGLTLLGEDVQGYKAALIATARSMQNATGGFGGGHGQSSHLATTYAVVLSLAIVGGADCYDVIDRRALWKWLNSIKQPDGGFTMSVGGEEDVRGAYCAAVIISLLGVPLDLSPESPAWDPETKDQTLFTGLANYVQRCQTYEGGISAQPGSEAHGGYAFCALACLSILDAPDRSIPRHLNVPRLVAWLAARQYAPEGGFSGRTNKLVDGCYSHWVGDCWPLVEAVLERTAAGTSKAKPTQTLFSREGLIRYILNCCQDNSKRGGLRDKPGKMSDAYHSCYALSGLSSAQHKWQLVDQPPVVGADGVAIYTEPVWQATPFAFGGAEGVQVFEEEDRLATVHPVYTISADCVEQCKAYFQAKTGF